MTKLSVNVNKIAVLRNSRGGSLPDLLNITRLCITSGADGITVHPRSDMRHIKPEDLKQIKDLTDEYPTEFNIEGNPYSEKKGNYPGFLELIKLYKPHQCTLVPDSPDQLTSDHGWNLLKDNGPLKEIIHQIKSLQVRVSLFLDPDIKQISEAKKFGADRIELYTGSYAESFLSKTKVHNCLKLYQQATAHANKIGLGVNAGHDLNLDNLKTFLKIGTIQEVSIGHSLISDALIYGLERTVKLYLKACK